MSRPILKIDTEREIVLAEPRLGPTVLFTVLVAAAAAVWVFFPGARIAPILLGVFALWALLESLRIHQLRLDLDQGRYSYHHGYVFAPPHHGGTFDDIVGVFVDHNPAIDGLAASRLRSCVVQLEFNVWPEDGAVDGVFQLGFPMGPRIAAEKAADYARRLGVESADRTEAEPTDGPHPEPMDEPPADPPERHIDA